MAVGNLWTREMLEIRHTPNKRAVTITTIEPANIGRCSFLNGISRKLKNPPIHQPSNGKFKMPILVTVTKKLIEPINPLSNP